MDESTLPKYRYFIIPRFNKCYNVEKLETLSVSKICPIHGRYIVENPNGSVCIILLYANKERTEKEIRESFSNMSTSKIYITIDEKECKSTRLFFFSTHPEHKSQSGVKNLLNTFAKKNYSIVPVNKNTNNCNYWIIDFRSIIFAKHAINFIPKIPFETSKIFISENPFHIPLIQITGFNPIQSYFSKNSAFESFKLDYPNRSCLSLEKDSSFVLAEDTSVSNFIINKINYTQYKNHNIIAQYFLPDMYVDFMLCFKIKVQNSDSNQSSANSTGDNLNDIRNFYVEMNKIGPVYQVFENKEEPSNFYVIFKDRKTLRKIFNDQKYSVLFANCTIFSLYNFPPNTTELNIKSYLEKSEVRFNSIEKCDKNKNMLPHFRICIDFGYENDFQSFFNDAKCVYRSKTRPFFVKYLFEYESESLCEKIINKSNTIQILPQGTKTIVDVYNEYSQFGLINLLFFNPDVHRYYITYSNHDQYIKAKQYMDKTYPQSNSITIEKEKSVSEKKVSGNKINIEIKKSSILDVSILISSDDDEYDSSEGMNPIVTNKIDTYINFPNPQGKRNSNNVKPANKNITSSDDINFAVPPSSSSARSSNDFQKSKKPIVFTNEFTNNKPNEKKSLIINRKVQQINQPDEKENEYSSEFDEDDEITFNDKLNNSSIRSSSFDGTNDEKNFFQQKANDAFQTKKKANSLNGNHDIPYLQQKPKNNDNGKKSPNLDKNDDDDDMPLFVPQKTAINTKKLKNYQSSNKKPNETKNDDDDDDGNTHIFIRQKPNNSKKQKNNQIFVNTKKLNKDSDDDDDDNIFVRQVPKNYNKKVNELDENENGTYFKSNKKKDFIETKGNSGLKQNQTKKKSDNFNPGNKKANTPFQSNKRKRNQTRRFNSNAQNTQKNPNADLIEYDYDNDDEIFIINNDSNARNTFNNVQISNKIANDDDDEDDNTFIINNDSNARNTFNNVQISNELANDDDDAENENDDDNNFINDDDDEIDGDDDDDYDDNNF